MGKLIVPGSGVAAPSDELRRAQAGAVPFTFRQRQAIEGVRKAFPTGCLLVLAIPNSNLPGGVQFMAAASHGRGVTDPARFVDAMIQCAGQVRSDASLLPSAEEPAEGEAAAPESEKALDEGPPPSQAS